MGLAPLLGFAFALAESGIGLGAVLPGEVAISGLAALDRGPVAAVALVVAVASGAVVGDHLGYGLGRFAGVRVRGSRMVARLGVDRWDRASSFIRRRGFWAVLVSRVLPVVRTVTPVVAGAGRLRYPIFLLASVLGAILWATLWVGVGVSAATTGLLDSPVAWVVLSAVAGVGLAVRVLRRRSSVAVPTREHRDQADRAAALAGSS